MAPSTEKPYRVMLDTSVLIAGIVWRRWPHAVLQHARRRDFRLVLAPVVIAEAEGIFRRKFLAFLPAFQMFLADCGAEIVPDPSSSDIKAHGDLMRDINDVPIALAAIQAGVDYFLSEDKDFTDRADPNASLHARLRVLLPGTFLRDVMGWSSEQLEAVRRR